MFLGCHTMNLGDLSQVFITQIESGGVVMEHVLNEQRTFMSTVCKNNPRMQKARPIAHTYTYDLCLKPSRFWFF